MEEQLETYEEAKKSIRSKKGKRKVANKDADDFDLDLFDEVRPKVGMSDYVDVGSKLLIGGGLGLLAGVASIAVVASAAEIVLAGAVTKIAGVVGGAIGLSWGVKKIQKKKMLKKEVF
ncbi:MAG: hypothetical protein HQK60_08775 [Deltaproteobacteria bacterium]|nr:hypothetical protein [Deltaproteobacteria bacterium]